MTIIIPAGSNIGPYLNTAVANQVFALEPGANYTCQNTPQITAANVKLIGAGSNIAITPASGATSGIIVKGAGFQLLGVNLSGPAVCLRVYNTDLLVSGCYFGSCSNGMILDAGSHRATVIGSTFDISGSDNIYATSDDLFISHCTFAGSVGEHCVRLDLDAFGRRPSNFVLRDSSLTNHNSVGKDALALRELTGGQVSRTTISGWATVGQQLAPGIHATNIDFIDCAFPTLRPGGAYIQFGTNVTGTMNDCQFAGSRTDACVAVGPGAVITATGSKIVANGFTPDPLGQINTGGKLIESGTAVVASF